MVLFSFVKLCIEDADGELESNLNDFDLGVVSPLSLSTPRPPKRRNSNKDESSKKRYKSEDRPATQEEIHVSLNLLNLNQRS